MDSGAECPSDFTAADSYIVHYAMLYRILHAIVHVHTPTRFMSSSKVL